MKPQPKATTPEISAEQLAVFNDTFASFNETIRQLNESYSALQVRHQRLSDDLTAANEKLVAALDQNIRTRNFLHNVLESLTAGVLTVDLDGRINAINKAGCDILRVKPSAAVGKYYNEILSGALAREHSLLSILDGKKSFKLVEKRIGVAGGEEVPISASSAPITDASEQIVGALEVFVDLTELRRMEDEVARVKGLAALGEVAAVVAHEVRNPLSGIAGFAALLRSELGEDHPQIAYVNKIIAGVDKLNRSVTSLLEYARDLRHEPREGDLNELLKETVDFFRVDLSARSSASQLHLELPRRKTICAFDRENLSGALINLLKNADESMPGGGTITVRLSADSRQSRIQVCDQGSSVPEAIREKIFTPFFTTREGGTGLGLALVKKVVDAHRGDILVSNNPDRGSTFTIELPLRSA